MARVQVAIPELHSDMLDHYLRVGAAVTLIAKLSLAKPLLNVNLQNGCLTLEKPERTTDFFGTCGVEPTAYDWESLLEAFGG